MIPTLSNKTQENLSEKPNAIISKKKRLSTHKLFIALLNQVQWYW